MSAIKHQAAILATIKDLHATKGWNAVYAYLKHAKIPHKVKCYDFGLDNRSNATAKNQWIEDAPDGCFRAHFCNRQVNSRGWNYNIIRAQEIQLI